MAYGYRGVEDRDEFIAYVDSLPVPESWKRERSVKLANPHAGKKGK